MDILNLITRKHQLGGHNTNNCNLQMCQDQESQGKIKELFQTEGDKKKRELNAAHASELDPLAAKDNTRTTGKM